MPAIMILHAILLLAILVKLKGGKDGDGRV